jgi:polysaccharide biosynthesis transport protein
MLSPDSLAKRGELVFAEQGLGSQPNLLRYVLFVLWYRRHMIIAAISATLLAAIVYLFITPARYTATTTLVLDAAQPPVAQNEAKGERRVDDAAVESNIDTIKSANNAVRVIKKLNLTEDPEFRSRGIISALKRWFSNSAASKSTPSAEEEALRTAIGTISAGLKVERVPKSYTVEIAYTSLDPKKAATIANTIAEAYIDDQLQAKFDLTKRARLWLQQGIAELRATATEAFKSIQDFKSQNNLLISADGKLAMDVELEQLTQSLAKARAETTLAQSRLAQIEAVLSTPGADGIPDATVTDALSNSVITKYRQQYLDDEKLAAEYGARYGTNHQTVTKLRTEMADLKRAMHEEMQRIAETYKSEVKVAQSREQAIEQRLTEVFQDDSGNRQAQVKLRELETAANTYRSVYEDFLTRYTQAVQQQSFPSAEARVITFASPGSKTSPNILLTLMLATIGGVNLGAAAVFIREQMHRPIYTRDQFARELGVNCIAAFPAPERPKEAPRLIASLASLKDLPAIGALSWRIPKQKIANLPTLLFDDEDPFSSTSEALRNIEVAIDLRRISHETRTLAIVSALAGEGKSSIAMSLAAMIGRAGRKVLLVDCDFRNPSLTHLLGLQNGIGILELLCGEAKLTDVTYHHNQCGFDFLCGPTKVRPARIANILHSEPMSNLFAALKEHYDYMIADLPPILPVIDVRACAHLFDAFALVAEWGKTSVDDLDRSFKTAPLVGERLLGVVLNKVDVAAIQLVEGTGYAAYGRYA